MSSCHRSRGGGDPAMVVSPSQGHRDKQPVTSRDKLELPINLTHVFGRWGETHTCMRMTCKLHTERPQNRRQYSVRYKLQYYLVKKI